ncbi:hypothetical protein H7849_08200 [Alloacidobacterium dinghuense]|uniref:Uncharacterized protein n=1 Tax=Alloacidobacterium dinghuense TaxID=2763107 RepID=A0A7G8BMV7_9BACT|nr:permease prefix domain 1-containing protein [Alloacidobacterium dinghuense]QNI33877.1 hypothetical protein H7849_08200 [Alloacidobacterium dinghuense]
MRAHFRQEKLSADLDEELQFHLTMREQLNVEKGMSKEEAYKEARRQIGNPTRLKEQMREIDLFTFPETVWQDLRFAFRMLAKHPGFTSTGILALGLGVGVNTAIFTVYRAVFGLVPALESSKPNLTSALREDGTHFAFLAGKGRMRDGLICIQVAICLVLMTSGGLLIRHRSDANPAC